VLISSHNAAVSRLEQWIGSHEEDPLLPDVMALRSAVLERSHANALHILPSKRLFKTVSYVLHELVCAWLLPSEDRSRRTDSEATQSLLMRLHQAGLGGDSGQRAFAHAMNAVIDSYVQSAEVKVDWVGRQSVTGRLRSWIRETFVVVARDGLECLTNKTPVAFFETEMTDWESVALQKLAEQRIKYCFEYVRAWDHSAGAIADLKVGLRCSPSFKPS